MSASNLNDISQNYRIAELRCGAEKYECSSEFLELFEADTFDEEVNTDYGFMGFVRCDNQLILAAEYIYDMDVSKLDVENGEDPGRGWYNEELI